MPTAIAVPTRIVVFIDLVLKQPVIESMPAVDELPALTLELPLGEIEDWQRRRIAAALQERVRQLAKIEQESCLMSREFSIAFYALKLDLPDLVRNALKLRK